MDCSSLTDELANNISHDIKSLEVLQVSSQLSVDTVDHLTKHTGNLLSLDLDGIIVDIDNVISIINKLPCLHTLNIPYSLLCDSDLLDISGHKSLRVLIVQESDITNIGIQQMKEIAPLVQIICD